MAVVWLTGPSGAGKSTIAGIVRRRLQRAGRQVAILDGDELRTGLCSDLGFSVEDRAENIRRVAETARLLVDNGIVVVVAMISPLRASREAARERFEADKFIEVHVDAPLEVTERRDPKGLYRRARAGEIPQFTGIDSPYEPPTAPELRLDTVTLSPEECAQAVLEALARVGATGPQRRGEMAASD